MSFMNRIKDVLTKCDHHWHEVNRLTAVNIPESTQLREASPYMPSSHFEIYCPKCKRRKTVTKTEWVTLQNIQKIEIKRA